MVYYLHCDLPFRFGVVVIRQVAILCTFLGLAVLGVVPALAFQPASPPTAVKIEGILKEGSAALPVTLYIQGEDSLLEVEGSKTVFLEGRAQRQPDQAEAWPAVQCTPGHQDAFFMPFAVLGRLEQDYRQAGPDGGGPRYQRTVKWNRFLGRSGEEFKFEARFNADSGLLAELSIEDCQASEDTRLVYSDYRRVRGVDVPHRVERYLGGELERTLEVESIDFLPRLEEGLIQIIEPQSR